MADKVSSADDKCKSCDSIDELKRKICIVKKIEERLQNERDELLLEKSKLVAISLPKDEEILKNISHVISDERGREILMILKEIHQYDLELLEAESKLEKQKIDSEIKELQEAMYLATTPPHSVESSNFTNLHKWYLQIKALHPKDFDYVTIHSVYLKKSKIDVNRMKEQLEFSINYSGVILRVAIECISKLIIQEENKQIWDMTDCSITSDIDSKEVSRRGEHLLKFCRPVRMFVQEIIDFMSTSIVAYV